MNKRIRKKKAKQAWQKKQQAEKEFYEGLAKIAKSPYWSAVLVGGEWRVFLK